MVRISGYGQTGPYRDRPGFGAIGEAMGGMRHITGDPDRPPARVGSHRRHARGAARRDRRADGAAAREDQGGRGQVVDVALYESVFNVMESLVPEFDRSASCASARQRAAGHRAVERLSASDGGYVLIAGNGDPIFRRLMNAIGRADLATIRRSRSNDGRAAQCAMIDEAIAAWTLDAAHRGGAGGAGSGRGAGRAASTPSPTSPPIRTTRRAA